VKCTQDRKEGTWECVRAVYVRAHTHTHTHTPLYACLQDSFLTVLVCLCVCTLIFVCVCVCVCLMGETGDHGDYPPTHPHTPSQQRALEGTAGGCSVNSSGLNNAGAAPAPRTIPPLHQICEETHYKRRQE